MERARTPCTPWNAITERQSGRALWVRGGCTEASRKRHGDLRVGLITRRSRVQIPPPLRRKPLGYIHSQGFPRVSGDLVMAHVKPVSNATTLSSVVPVRYGANMDVTKRYQSLRELTNSQIQALDVLVTGGTHTEAADAAGVHRVSRLHLSMPDRKVSKSRFASRSKRVASTP